MSILDSTGRLGRTLQARDGEVWLLRPDAHIAAVLERPGPAEVAAALSRCLAIEASQAGNEPSGREG
jgi:pentachlorophenol monooxygenase/3-(3-hydroxy-phenyl)propionate hydroxylase